MLGPAVSLQRIVIPHLSPLVTLAPAKHLFLNILIIAPIFAPHSNMWHIICSGLDYQLSSQYKTRVSIQLQFTTFPDQIDSSLLVINWCRNTNMSPASQSVQISYSTCFVSRLLSMHSINPAQVASFSLPLQSAPVSSVWCTVQTSRHLITQSYPDYDGVTCVLCVLTMEQPQHYHHSNGSKCWTLCNLPSK